MSVRDDGFEPGNAVAVQHGAYSPAEIEKRAATVHGELLRVAPWIDEPHFAPACDAYLKAVARSALAHDALTSGKAKLSPRLLEAATSAARLAWRMGDELGLSPAGHAKLKMLAAGGEHAEQSIADLIEQGRQIRERREAEDAAAVDDDGEVVEP
jgi:hypothetical protein